VSLLFVALFAALLVGCGSPVAGPSTPTTYQVDRCGTFTGATGDMSTACKGNDVATSTTCDVVGGVGTSKGAGSCSAKWTDTVTGGSICVHIACAPSSAPAALVVDCHAHSFLSVGTYEGQWADWHLTVDVSGVSRAELAVVEGPSGSSVGTDPALTVRLPGDAVAFDIWAANGRGHFVQPYPGLEHGYDVAVDCE